MRQHARQTVSLPVQPNSPEAQPLEYLHIQEASRNRVSRSPQVATSRSRSLVDMHLDAGPSEFISIMGPSSSGKTMLLNLLAGLDRPVGRKSRRRGACDGWLSADNLVLLRRRNLGCVLQDFPLLDRLTLAENVALPLSLDGESRQDISQRVREALLFLEMAEVDMERYPHEVSAVQRQRASLARAIVRRPLLLLADEPADNLDPSSARILLELLQKLNRQQQTTILLLTHDPFSASYSQRVVFIVEERVTGHLKRCGSQEAFFQEILETIIHLEQEQV